MTTSRKYLTMNIRRPNNLIETIDTNQQPRTNTNSHQHITPKKSILTMHTANQINQHHHHQQTQKTPGITGSHPQPKTYLPMKRTLLTTPSVKSKSSSQSVSLSSSLNNSQANYTGNGKHTEPDESGANLDNYSNDPEANKTGAKSSKSKSKLINLPNKRLVNTSYNDTSRLRQSFFMNEFPNSSASTQSKPVVNKHVTNISNITNIKATFECFDSDEESTDNNNKKSDSTDTDKVYLNATYGSGNNYTVKYSSSSNAPPNPLPSKHHSITRARKTGTDAPKTQTKTNLNKSMSDKTKSSTSIVSSADNISTTSSKQKETSNKSSNYRNMVLNNNNDKQQKMTPQSSKNQSTNSSIVNCSQMNTSNSNSAKYLQGTYTKPASLNRSSYPAAATEYSQKKLRENIDCESCESHSAKLENSSTLVDQMASFIDELKDFIDDRLIDTTSQLEMANQRISGLYNNLNYLTQEFVELKVQNEELKLELQLTNNSKNNSPILSQASPSLTPPSYYHQLSQSRHHKGRNSSSSFKTKKLEKLSNDCEPITMNSSSKTSSIETTSSSTSESLTMSQSALASSSQVNQSHKNNSPVENKHEETIRQLGRNEIILFLKNQELNDLTEKYNKLTSSNSSVNSVNFYDNMSIANKLEVINNWPDSGSPVEQNRQYLRTSSQIELNNIVEGKYGSIEFDHDEDEHLNDEQEFDENDEHEEELENCKQNNNRNSIEVEQLNFENKFNQLKEADLRNSLKMSSKHATQANANTKLVHHMHAPLIPYSNFRDFDAQYSWDYTDNLVNKFAGKLTAGANVKN